ncbi:unnamed protein product [Moneuplotes crassus]|uniref:Uncharacterized protein n=1 Tax=Euplotes crassus TaxID=5936 RepID=A0AAD1UD82_EUPCR|nr:unnamed protein product [Moneuplotes crassus]
MKYKLATRNKVCEKQVQNLQEHKSLKCHYQLDCIKILIKLLGFPENFGRNRKDSLSPKNVYNLVARIPNQNETVSRNLKKMMKNSKKANQYQSNALTQNQSAISIEENDIKAEVDTVPKPELPSNLRLLEQNSECKGKRAIQEITRFLQGSSVSNEGPKVDFQNIHSITPIYQSWSPIQPLPPYLRSLLCSSQIGHRLKYPYPQRKPNFEQLTTENIISRKSMSVKRLQPVRRVEAVRRIKKKKLRRNGNKVGFWVDFLVQGMEFGRRFRVLMWYLGRLLIDLDISKLSSAKKNLFWQTKKPSYCFKGEPKFFVMLWRSSKGMRVNSLFGQFSEPD